MRIELLTSPGCPNAEAARQTVIDCLNTLGIEAQIVERIGSHPSPTVLVNGIDVMRPDAGESTGDACRLDLPTSHRVLDALRAHMNGQVETGSGTPQSVVAAVQQLPPPVRELHRAVLRGFRDHGEVVRDDLRSTAAAVGVDLDEALMHLAGVDLVHTGHDGYIEIAYPFCRRATGHTVHLSGHGPVAAMCAIDALGIPLMTGTDAMITSADPDTGALIRVERRGDDWIWHPATAVVVVGHAGGCGTLATTACRSITFHLDRLHAQSHLDRRPELQGLVVGQDDAVALADAVFGTLLVDWPNDSFGSA